VSVFALLKCVAIAFADVASYELHILLQKQMNRQKCQGAMPIVHWDVKRLCGPGWDGGNGDRAPSLCCIDNKQPDSKTGLWELSGQLCTSMCLGVTWQLMAAGLCMVPAPGLPPLAADRPCCQCIVVMLLHNESLHEITCYYMHVIPCNRLLLKSCYLPACNVHAMCVTSCNDYVTVACHYIKAEWK
jgi:hypothetical protein